MISSKKSFITSTTGNVVFLLFPASNLLKFLWIAERQFQVKTSRTRSTSIGISARKAKAFLLTWKIRFRESGNRSVRQFLASNKYHQIIFAPGGSPGLVVKVGHSCSKGHEFKSRHHLLDGHFFTYLFVVKFAMFVWKDENKWKWGQSF